MKHLGTRNLSTPHLVLRRIRMSDAEAMFQNWAHDPEVTKFLTWQLHESVETTKKLLKKWVNDYKDPEVYLWAITLRTNLDRPIGTEEMIRQIDEVTWEDVRKAVSQLCASPRCFAFLGTGAEKIRVES